LNWSHAAGDGASPRSLDLRVEWVLADMIESTGIGDHAAARAHAALDRVERPAVKSARSL